LQTLKSVAPLQKSKFFTDPFEVSIENFYRAETDLNFLKKSDFELSENDKLQVAEWYFELQDWFSQQVNEVLYKKRLRDFEYIFVRENTITALEAVLKSLQTLRPDLKFCETKMMFKLVDIIKKLGLPIRLTIADQIETIQREIKGYQTAIAIKKKDVRAEKSDSWLKLVSSASKHRGYRIDPKVTTLAEWAEIIKDMSNERN
jgi:hypothetical protein